MDCPSCKSRLVARPYGIPSKRYSVQSRLCLGRWSLWNTSAKTASKGKPCEGSPARNPGPPEEYFLVCPECRGQLQSEIDFVNPMRSAAMKITDGYVAAWRRRPMVTSVTVRS